MKKLFTIIFALISALSLLTACGDGGGLSPDSDNGGGKPKETAANDVTVGLDRVVADAEGIKVTLTRYEYKDFYGQGMYNTFYFTIENNTGKEIRLGIEYASVNGCMLVEMGDNAQKMKTQPGETNDKAYVSISDEALKKRGITAIRDFEFTPRFVAIDSSLLFGGSDYLALEPVTVQLPADPDFTQAFDVDGVVVLNEEGVKITAIQVEYDLDLGKTRVLLFIENDSGMDIEVSANAKVNGERIDSTSTYLYYQGQVTKEKVSFDYLSFHNPYLKEKGIDKIQEVEMTLTVEGLTWDLFSGGTVLIDHKNVTVSFDAAGKAK